LFVCLDAEIMLLGLRYRIAHKSPLDLSQFHSVFTEVSFAVSYVQERLEMVFEVKEDAKKILQNFLEKVLSHQCSASVLTYHFSGS
jgi:hypothetical protein